jgi:hypothetical protein
VERSTAGGSTINLCFNDLTKDFDKSNQSALIIKLMKECIPRARNFGKRTAELALSDTLVSLKF